MTAAPGDAMTGRGNGAPRRLPESPFIEAVRGRAAARADATFIWDQDGHGRFRPVSHGRFARQVEGLRRWWARHAKPDELVAVAAARSADCVAAIVAGMAEGMTVAPVNPRLRGPHMGRILDRAAPSAVLLDGAALHALVMAGPDVTSLPRPHLGLINQHRLLPFQRGAYEPSFPDLAPAIGEEGGEDLDVPCPWRPEACGLCLFTSGSTGEPKGVLISSGDVADRARAEIEVFGLADADVLLGVLPFSFDVGCNQMMTAVLTGCTLVLLDSWMPADITAAAARFGVTGISCVPSIWRDFLATGIRFDTDGAHRGLRYVTISGGDLAEQELRRLKETVGHAGFYKTYGQTEAFRLTCLLPHEFARRPTSVGRGFASVRVGIVREDLSPVGPHEEGELILVGLGAMTGYLGGSGTDEKLIPNPLRAGPHDPAAAVRTGDFGFFDEEGYVFLRGRRDAMIKVHGNRVYPSEVARLILGVPGVRDAVAVGVPKPSAEAVLVAFVVLADDAPEEDLQRRMRQRLPPHMVPHVTIRCQGIPLTAGGKHDLTGLQRQAAHAVSGRGE